MLKRLCFIILLLPQIVFANFSDKPEVNHFIIQMVHKHHFVKSKLVALFNQVKIRPIIIHSINTPLEQKPWYAYQTLFVTEWRIRQGVAFWNKYQKALERAEKIYGVPASIIVATIGVETKYGKDTGSHRVIDALSNVAFSDSPRAPFFKNELEQFLLLAREQHLDPLKVMGSYAGAIGQPQFMPSSYRHYAVNFSGNSKIDLSSNEVDVIGSIANYYKQHGWEPHQPIVIRTHLRPQSFGFLAYLTHKSLSVPNQKTKFIELQGYYGREYWLGYSNFEVIKRYNPSNLYAMAVYQLSYYISMLKGKTDNA
ncbi:MAG TPA: lytic murein transglycosylase B [Gammaproteobacteria bacterium]|nr:lytic murein transglycosylase B [Gammaproteobacteria bacterium]